jgi:hypothetical protein
MPDCFMEMTYCGKAWKNPPKTYGFSHTLPQYLEKSEKTSDFSTFPQNLSPPIIEMWKNALSSFRKYGFL